MRDVPSDGRSHRVFGHKSQRTHHLLSDLELAVFLSIEWNHQNHRYSRAISLEREDTLRIASDNGIRHPSDTGVNLYMSSDFLIDSNDQSQPTYVIQAKRSEALLILVPLKS